MTNKAQPKPQRYCKLAKMVSSLLNPRRRLTLCINSAGASSSTCHAMFHASESNTVKIIWWLSKWTRHFQSQTLALVISLSLSLYCLYNVLQIRIRSCCSFSDQSSWREDPSFWPGKELRGRAGEGGHLLSGDLSWSMHVDWELSHQSKWASFYDFVRYLKFVYWVFNVCSEIHVQMKTIPATSRTCSWQRRGMSCTTAWCIWHREIITAFTLPLIGELHTDATFLVRLKPTFMMIWF